ncbi:hypothetical protein CEXT_53411 [Caerostris extrusa]|uniref:Uncharacterized protein n=1 Tax=Caerostris extrusa TaxID=172846 RepID=A0AAV4URJ2_CAEEX|nr:hypothetical protein CEXT_53411 [Caerostris extrusa]
MLSTFFFRGPKCRPSGPRPQCMRRNFGQTGVPPAVIGSMIIDGRLQSIKGGCLVDTSRFQGPPRKSIYKMWKYVTEWVNLLIVAVLSTKWHESRNRKGGNPISMGSRE